MENEKSSENLPDCCKPAKKPNTILQGITFGLIPHIGCIAFIVFTVLGVTVATSFFKPLLMNRYFFHALIALSFVFATASITIYLKQNKMLSLDGAKRKWKYIATMYGTTLGINLLLFMVVFPYAANISAIGGNDLTGAAIGAPGTLASLALDVDIPCPGHAPLITGELKTIAGVKDVQFSFPNKFDVNYNPSQTSKTDILALAVFDEYPATVVSESSAPAAITAAAPSSGGCCGGSGGCGGGCGGSCGGGGSACSAS